MKIKTKHYSGVQLRNSLFGGAVTNLYLLAALRNASTTAFQDRVGRFIKQLEHHAEALFSNATSPVNLTELVMSGDQPELGSRDVEPAEATDVIDGSCKRGRSLNTDTKDATLTLGMLSSS